MWPRKLKLLGLVLCLFLVGCATDRNAQRGSADSATTAVMTTLVALESADKDWDGYYLDFEGGPRSNASAENVILNKGTTSGSKWTMQKLD